MYLFCHHVPPNASLNRGKYSYKKHFPKSQTANNQYPVHPTLTIIHLGRGKKEDTQLTIQIIRRHEQFQAKFCRNLHIRNILAILHLFMIVEIFTDFFEYETTEKKIYIISKRILKKKRKQTKERKKGHTRGILMMLQENGRT